MALVDKHPLLRAFFTYTLVSRELFEEHGHLHCTEVRRDPKSGEKQKLTYRIDTSPLED